MKVFGVKAYGPVEKLESMEIPAPVPGKKEISIRIQGSAVNPADAKVLTGKVKMLHGRNFPLVVGYDYCGTVESLGEAVTEFKPGDKVFGFLPYSGKNRQGTFGEKIAVPVSSVALAPRSLDFEKAGTCPTVALTALQALRKTLAQKPGCKVLINGAAGGVGCYAVQIAKILGAKVTAVCSTASFEFVKALGADELIDYRSGEISKLQQRYFVVFDVVSNMSFFKARKLIEPGGRFVSLLPSLSVIGGFVLSPVLKEKCSMVIVKSQEQDLKQIAKWFDEKRLQAPVAQSYELKDIVKALHHLDQGGVQGKIAVKII